jgi:hypothetical protein
LIQINIQCIIDFDEVPYNSLIKFINKSLRQQRKEKKRKHTSSMINKLKYIITITGVTTGVVVMATGALFMHIKSPKPVLNLDTKTTIKAINRDKIYHNNIDQKYIREGNKDSVQKNMDKLAKEASMTFDLGPENKITSEEIVYEEGGTYSLRRIFRTADNKRFLQIKRFGSDLTPIEGSLHRAEVLEVEVFPRHWPNLPQYPVSAASTDTESMSIVSPQKAQENLDQLSQLLNKSVTIIPTSKSFVNPPNDLRDGYKILVPAPENVSEIFTLYEKIIELAGSRGIVKLQAP